jgi:DnaJ-class molecular chaperone
MAAIEKDSTARSSAPDSTVYAGISGRRIRRANLALETIMANEKGPNIKKKAKCKNCEGKGLVKKGDKVVKCQRCHGTGLR